jgi:CheY-like chemotaxis protein
MTTEPLRVFLLDDHELVRRGVRDMLEAEGDIVVVGEAATAAEALARVPAVRPQVAVLDVRLPDGDGITVCRELRSTMPELACLMLTSFSDDEALLGAVLAGGLRLRPEGDPQRGPRRRRAHGRGRGLTARRAVDRTACSSACASSRRRRTRSTSSPTRSGASSR